MKENEINSLDIKSFFKKYKWRFISLITLLVLVLIFITFKIKVETLPQDKFNSQTIKEYEI